MKTKKTLIYFGIIVGIIAVIVLGLMVKFTKSKNENIVPEIVPEEEINNSQLRQTIVTLYFLDKESEELKPEARKIDARLLLENPYQKIINLLLEGPKNEQLINIIPENTKLNSAEIENGIVVLDFSDDFIKDENLGENKEKLIISSILKTLLELSEVNGIKILINGEENLAFADNEINFNNIFN